MCTKSGDTDLRDDVCRKKAQKAQSVNKDTDAVSVEGAIEHEGNEANEETG